MRRIRFMPEIGLAVSECVGFEGLTSLTAGTCSEYFDLTLVYSSLPGEEGYLD